MSDVQNGSLPRPRSVLVCVDTGAFDAEASLSELRELARTAGAEVVATLLQRRETFDAATCMGRGKLNELAELCRAEEIELLLFDHELTATQLRNIEKATDVRVVDRTMLILDIFAARARSREGRLQVELAQQKYRLPRLAGLGTELSRQGGGIGTRGPGETRLETDRRHIRRRIAALERELREIGERRERSRLRRKKDGVLTAALVGYTNVGKSTLLNTLTEAGVLAEDKLFATLDPTARAITLPDGRNVLLIDTVGLLRRLPHHLVEAFHATLEEAASADLILHLCDATAPDLFEQMAVTEELLDELGCAGTPVLRVLNKCDIAASIPHVENPQVAISARTGTGIPALLGEMARLLPPTLRQMQLLLPYTASGLLARIRENGKILSEEYTENGIKATALVELRLQKEAAVYQQ